MKRVCVVAMCGLSLLVSVGLRAQDEKPAAIDPNQVNADAEVGAPSGGKMVEQALLDYAVAKKITYGAAVDGRIFYQAKANVEVDETNAQWGKARTLAFEKAVGKAEAQFARDQYGKQFVETVRELFDNQSDKADEFPEEAPTDSRLQALFDKIVALKDAELDEKLEKLGIDPKEFSAKPAPQKLTQFRQAMTKRMATRAIGETAGMMIVQTFEGAAEDGTRAVGVVLCYSPKLRQLAYDIAKGRAPLLTGTPKKALAEHIPTDPQQLLDQFGVRVLFDEAGKPVLVSYAQWSYNYAGKNARTLDRNRDMASERALELADSYITEFLAGKINLVRETTTGEVVEEFMTKDGDGNITAQQTVEIIDVLREKARTTATADLAGRLTYRKWSHKNPNGIEIVGVVRVWTLGNLESTKAIRNWRPENGKPRPAAAGDDPGLKSKRELRQGIDTDVNDF